MYYQGKISNYEFELFKKQIDEFIRKNCNLHLLLNTYSWESIMECFAKLRDIKNKLFAKHGAAFTLFQTQYECIKTFNANHHIKEMPDTLDEFICIVGYSIEQSKK